MIAAAGVPFLKAQPVIQVKLLSPWAQPPLAQTEGSVGYDLCLPYQALIRPRSTRTFDLQIALAIPPGLYGQLASRSSLAAKGITMEGGVIDQDYQGPLKVIIRNNGRTHQNFSPLEAICQILFIKTSQPTIQEVKQLDSTKRGQGGFGSTNRDHQGPPIEVHIARVAQFRQMRPYICRPI